jgi:hypothetical protein
MTATATPTPTLTDDALAQGLTTRKCTKCTRFKNRAAGRGDFGMYEHNAVCSRCQGRGVILTAGSLQRALVVGISRAQDDRVVQGKAHADSLDTWLADPQVWRNFFGDADRVDTDGTRGAGSYTRHNRPAWYDTMRREAFDKKLDRLRKEWVRGRDTLRRLDAVADCTSYQVLVEALYGPMPYKPKASSLLDPAWCWR